MDSLSIFGIILLLNNIVWMFFLWLFIPDRRIQKQVQLPKIKVGLPEGLSKPFKKEDRPEDYEDLLSGNIKPNDILKLPETPKE